ncbi:Dabb family protein [Streptomyces echinoruber]|uniref:Uncharacterized protein n=1 Tax=Streptomyces echinoruber TaxID=68898 RepID=A0A918RFT0_9ACTN|nr:Dabb family protein [Streptomyces echinoruber]GGZ97274.1 hypothetical protein GCM10010389_40560 [Streptomyces echinoruber]
MITHTLVYRFSEPLEEETRQRFFAEAREVALGTGLVRAFDHQPQLVTLDGRPPRAVIAQLAFDDVDALRSYAGAPAVRAFIEHWKSELSWEIDTISHHPLRLSVGH